MVFSNRGNPLNPTPMEMTNGFGIYVHIPFCVHKCSYCEFYSFTRYTSEDFASYTNALVQEIKSGARWLQKEHQYSKRVTSIFLGGGTPSLLPVPLLTQVFRVLGEEFEFDPQCEITTEANPETISPEWATEIRQTTPINRISLGAQSFDAANLKLLERLGSASSIERATRILRDVGFSNYSLDLIIGISGQSGQGVKEDIMRAYQLGPKHLSAYNLSLKPGHPAYPGLPNEDLGAEIYELAVEELERLGFCQYEISNFSHPGFESRHNLLYWSGGDYLGVGTSAASRFFWNGLFHHRKQPAEFSRYLEASEFSLIPFEKTSLQQTQLEATFLELRRNDGVDTLQFAGRYGVRLQEHPKLKLFLKEKLVTLEGHQLSLTKKGRLLADTVTSHLVD